MSYLKKARRSGSALRSEKTANMRFVEERETLRRQQFKPTVAASKEVFKSCEVCVSVLRQKKLFSWIFKSCCRGLVELSVSIFEMV